MTTKINSFQKIKQPMDHGTSCSRSDEGEEPGGTSAEKSVILINPGSNNQIIQKVFMNRRANQKLVTIPKYCDIEEGDFVEIIKREFKE